METETVAARNVVDLLVHEEFDSSICGSHMASSNPLDNVTSTTEREFVLGWDC